MYFEYFILTIVIFLIFLRLRKKIIKYKSIYNQNGFDGVYLYFVNKNFTKTGLSNFIDKKKNILGKEISKISNNKILYGPYSGTKILSSYGWSNIDFCPKYLGCYEYQVQKKIIDLNKKKKFDYFIDLGASEGYHIVSLLKKKFFKQGLAFEISKKSREILKKNAQINKVKNRIRIYGDANLSSLKNALKDFNHRKLLFLVDIEGKEYDLFNKDFCKIFSNGTFIIEEHPFNVWNKKKIKIFKQNIKKYYKVGILKDIYKNPFNFSVLEKYSDDEKYLMMSEGRPQSMEWVILRPKR
tara:strand:- start:445 stop:1335 length:891 start_codon:yes stop_codon:yes gene_type:complete